METKIEIEISDERKKNFILEILNKNKIKYILSYRKKLERNLPTVYLIHILVDEKNYNIIFQILMKFFSHII